MSNRFIRDDRGSALIELALALPMLLLILFGVADLGRFLYAAIEVTNAASAGAEYATVSISNGSNYTGMQTAAQNDAADISGLQVATSSFCKCLNGSAAACTAGSCGGTSIPPTYVQVTTSATFSTLFSYTGLPASVPLSGLAVRRIK